MVMGGCAYNTFKEPFPSFISGGLFVSQILGFFPRRTACFGRLEVLYSAVQK
jgi:hypothetical protein